MGELLTRAAYGRLIGRTTATIKRAIREGRLTAEFDGRRWTIDASTPWPAPRTRKADER